MARLSLFALVLALGVAPGGTALAEPRRAQVAEKLVAVVWDGGEIDGMIEATTRAMAREALIRGRRYGTSEKEARDLETRIRGRIREMVPSWRKSLVEMYATALNPDEMEAVIAFHRSVAGEKFAKVGPKIAGTARLRFATAIRGPVEREVEEFLVEKERKDRERK